MSNDSENEEIKVTDKRKFDEKGNPRETAETNVGKTEEKLEEEPSEPDSEAVSEPPEPETTGEAEITFKTFVLTLASQAMVHMGVAPDPIEGKVKTSLPHAKQMIDIISMLREKTRGNLEAEEITMLDNMLFELRMMFVELSKEK